MQEHISRALIATYPTARHTAYKLYLT